MYVLKKDTMSERTKWRKDRQEGSLEDVTEASVDQRKEAKVGELGDF